MSHSHRIIIVVITSIVIMSANRYNLCFSLLLLLHVYIISHFSSMYVCTYVCVCVDMNVLLYENDFFIGGFERILGSRGAILWRW